ncbi:hypothetical protein [Streptomyces sp. NPDC055912]|uniref:hypothetical protein n=1 Tax=Streptomyces sp. NPDC055912 TaxID=3345660 RepID=UPI0035E023CD
MITADSDALLADVRGALKDGGVSQSGDRPGLPHLPEVETWLADGEVLLKVTVAPEERSGAAAIPDRVQNVLRSSGFVLALAHDCATPAAAPPAAALGSGRAVRVISRHVAADPALAPRRPGRSST